jgi:hypothetical protein
MMHALMRSAIVAASRTGAVVMVVMTATICASASARPVIVVEAGGVVQSIC